MSMNLNTKTLEVFKPWMELEGVQNGFYLQRTSGAPLHYIYSLERPLKTDKGHRYVNFNDPTPLVGGRVWVRSDGVTTIAVTPYVVTDNAGDIALDIIGDTSQLPTLHKETLVGAIREIYYNGGLDNIPISADEEIIVTALMISEKRLTLTDTPADGKVRLGVYRGCQQRQNIDYLLLPNTNIISWEGLSLELLLEENDVLYVEYNASN